MISPYRYSRSISKMIVEVNHAITINTPTLNFSSQVNQEIPINFFLGIVLIDLLPISSRKRNLGRIIIVIKVRDLNSFDKQNVDYLTKPKNKNDNLPSMFRVDNFITQHLPMKATHGVSYHSIKDSHSQVRKSQKTYRDY